MNETEFAQGLRDFCESGEATEEEWAVLAYAIDFVLDRDTADEAIKASNLRYKVAIARQEKPTGSTPAQIR